MKRIIVVVMLLSAAFVFPQEDKDVTEWMSAIEESTDLLEIAYTEIEKLEQENLELKEEISDLEIEVQENSNTGNSDIILQYEEEIEKLRGQISDLQNENDDLRVSISEASNAIKESNEILERAYDRIDEDQKEIARLREHIEALIASGVDIQTYNWNLMFVAGYPRNAGFQVAYNFPWLPDYGVTAGFNYNIDSTEPLAYVGVKINLK